MPMQGPRLPRGYPIDRLPIGLQLLEEEFARQRMPQAAMPYYQQRPEMPQPVNGGIPYRHAPKPLLIHLPEQPVDPNESLRAALLRTRQG